MANRIVAAQVSDTTDVASSTTAGNKKIKLLFFKAAQIGLHGVAHLTI